jgi:hypothetical protein
MTWRVFEKYIPGSLAFCADCHCSVHLMSVSVLQFLVPHPWTLCVFYVNKYIDHHAYEIEF